MLLDLTIMSVHQKSCFYLLTQLEISDVTTSSYNYSLVMDCGTCSGLLQTVGFQYVLELTEYSAFSTPHPAPRPPPPSWWFRGSWVGGGGGGWGGGGAG